MTNGSLLFHNSAAISRIESLARHLGVSTALLSEVASNSESHWKPGPDLRKPDGTIRKTHSATATLKGIHNRIKLNILRKTTYPNYLYGSLPKTLEEGSRSHIANAALHAGSRLIISADIQNFFPSIGPPVVHGVWQGFYPFGPNVAEILTRLTTYKGTLPQGWACSSYLAQLVFYDLEEDVVRYLRQNNFLYSRLTDDITISTNRTVSRQDITLLVQTLNRMLLRKGTILNRSKTRIDSPMRRQSVNKINVSVRGMTLGKKYRKSVRAQVHNLVTNPPEPEEALRSAIQSAKGKLSYLNKFHPNESRALLHKLNEFVRT